MKYIVELDGERIEVEIGADGVSIEGEPIQCHVSDIAGTPVLLLSVGREVHRVTVSRGAGRGEYDLWINGNRFHAEAVDERTRAIRDLARADTLASGPRPLVAPMPGLVVRVSVKEGDLVQAGQGLVVMEAMKMENELRAPGAGIVSVIRTKPGTAVEKGAVLVELRAAEVAE